MKRKEFYNILDECVERLLCGETIEQCLKDYPRYASVLEPMLRTALTLSRVSAVQPRPEFKARARYEFHSALQQVRAKRSRRFPVFQARWATTLVAIIGVLLLGGGSVVVAADRSMPDGVLYPVKLATEDLRVAAASSDTEKIELYTALADRRVEEIAYMVRKGKPGHVELVTQRLDAQLGKVAILAAARAGGVMMAPDSAGERRQQPYPMPTPRPASPVPAPTIKPTPTPPPSIVVPVPAPAPKVAEPMPGKENLDRKAVPDAAQAKKRAVIKEIVKRQALSNPERLRALLETAPESVKPALRRAIAISEQAYERALGSMDESEE